MPEGLVAFPTLQDGIDGMAFVEAALASNRSGDWISPEIA